MLESLTIFNPGGLIYYQYVAESSLFQRRSAAAAAAAAITSSSSSNAAAKNTYLKQQQQQQQQLLKQDESTTLTISPSTTATGGGGSGIVTNHNHVIFNCTRINQSLISKILLHPTSKGNNVIGKMNGDQQASYNVFIDDGLTFVWMTKDNNNNNNNDDRFYIVAVYPDIIFEGPRLYLKIWAEELIREVRKEYIIFYEADYQRYRNSMSSTGSTIGKDDSTITMNNNNHNDPDGKLYVRPDPTLFDKTFQLILLNSKSKGNNQAFDTDQDEDFQIRFEAIISNDPTKGTSIKNESSILSNAEFVVRPTACTIGSTLMINPTSTTTTTTTSAHLPQHLLAESSSMMTDPVRTIAAATAAAIGNTTGTAIHSAIEGSTPAVSGGNKKKGIAGKKMRNWHDGKNKVTDKAMAELDRSNVDGTNSGGTPQDAYQRALREARQAYLPTDDDLVVELLPKTKNLASIQDRDEMNKDDNNNNKSYFGSFFSQFSNMITLQDRVLTVQDLQKPCAAIAELLKSKNVASKIANELSINIQQQLVGKRLKALYSIDTAIKQALETSLQKILFHRNYDLLRNILTKQQQRRNNSSSSATSLLSRFAASSSSTTNNNNNNNYRSRMLNRPYVITVMGINGIGKTTTIAKLAYYFQQNNLKPLLVACDTFRSGAVEQLKIHADCLNVPFYAQGYSKDPSAVATAAITAATNASMAAVAASAANSNNNNNIVYSPPSTSSTTTTLTEPVDVILIDTAGRMQNNVPLMKALNKLIVENQPDCCLLVCEALVGHDGLNQFEMFSRAAGGFGTSSSSTTTTNRNGGAGGGGGIDGLILTKFDTVDKKVGASLTLTYETATPVVFVGTGQKYHHLTKLSVDTVIDSLFS